MSDEKVETLVITRNSGVVSSDECSGVLVAHKKETNQLVVKFHAFTRKGVSHRSKYVVYKTLKRVDCPTTIIFNAIEQIHFPSVRPRTGYYHDLSQTEEN